MFLGIDTSLGLSSLALGDAKGVLAERFEPARDEQATSLIAWIETLLAEQGLSYAQLDGISCSVGPGGFTGIRIGLATGRALGHAAAKPVTGYSNLQLMAYQATQAHPELQEAAFLALLPAGRAAFFVQSFHGSAAQNIAFMPSRSEFSAVYDTRPKKALPIVTTLEASLFPGHSVYTHDPASHGALLAQFSARHAEDTTHSASLPPIPLYIKPPDATRQHSYLRRLK